MIRLPLLLALSSLAAAAGVPAGPTADAIAAAAAAAPLFIQAFAAPLTTAAGADGGGFAARSDALRRLGLDLSVDCSRGTFLPPRRAPAAVVLPSLRMSVAAGACAAAEMKGNESSIAPTVSCAPFAVSYAYDPPMLLPPRTTPAAAIGPACSLTAALGKGGGNAAARTQVIVAPVTVTCPSLAALAKGDCVVDAGRGGKGQRVEEAMERVQRVLAAALE